MKYLRNTCKSKFIPCIHIPQTFGANLLSLEENTTIQLPCVSIYDHFISLHHYE